VLKGEAVSLSGTSCYLFYAHLSPLLQPTYRSFRNILLDRVYCLVRTAGCGIVEVIEHANRTAMHKGGYS
jgi:hypothetical protein